MDKFIVVLALLIGFFSIVFLLWAIIVYGICWAFGFEFLWRYVIGAWLVTIILKSIFKGK